MYLQNYLLQFPYVKNVAKLLFPPPFKQTLSQMLSSAYAKENILQWRSVLFLCLVTFVLLAQLKGATANCKAVYRQVLKVQAFLVQESTGIKLSHRFFSFKDTEVMLVKTRLCYLFMQIWLHVGCQCVCQRELLCSQASVHDQCLQLFWGLWLSCLILLDQFPSRTTSSRTATRLGVQMHCVMPFGYHGRRSCLRSSQC